MDRSYSSDLNTSVPWSRLWDCLGPLGELQVEAVVQEAKRDAKGVMPQYLRVDFLVDQQGWMTWGRPGRHVGLHLVA